MVMLAFLIGTGIMFAILAAKAGKSVAVRIGWMVGGILLWLVVAFCVHWILKNPLQSMLLQLLRNYRDATVMTGEFIVITTLSLIIGLIVLKVKARETGRG
jgi:hypothetical protein